MQPSPFLVHPTGSPYLSHHDHNSLIFQTPAAHWADRCSHHISVSELPQIACLEHRSMILRKISVAPNLTSSYIREKNPKIADFFTLPVASFFSILSRVCLFREPLSSLRPSLRYARPRPEFTSLVHSGFPSFSALSTSHILSVHTVIASVSDPRDQ